jgi:hypothetical protein
MKLQVSKIELDDLPKMTDEEFQAIRQRMRQDFSPTPPTDHPDNRAEAQPRDPVSVVASSPRPEPQPAKQGSVSTDPGEPADEW